VSHEDVTLPRRSCDHVTQDRSRHLRAVLRDAPGVRREVVGEEQRRGVWDLARGAPTSSPCRGRERLGSGGLAQPDARQDSERRQFLASPVDAVDGIVGVALVDHALPVPPAITPLGQEPAGQEHGGAPTITQPLDAEGLVVGDVGGRRRGTERPAERGASDDDDRQPALHAKPTRSHRSEPQHGETVTGGGGTA